MKPIKLKLKPCPACGGPPARSDFGMWVICTGLDCYLSGPVDDRDGKKWNALPRRAAKKRKVRK